MSGEAALSPAYTVEEPYDGISERSASVDDGEGSVASLDGLSSYMRMLMSSKARIEQELQVYQEGVRELRKACERPAAQLDELKSQATELSQRTHDMHLNKEQLIKGLSNNTLTLDSIDKSVNCVKQLVEEAVRTISNAQEFLNAHPHTPTPSATSASPPRFRDGCDSIMSADLNPDMMTELRSCLDKCKGHQEQQAKHKHWVMMQIEEIRTAHAKVKGVMDAKERLVLTSTADISDAVAKYRHGHVVDSTHVQLLLPVLVQYLDERGPSPILEPSISPTLKQSKLNSAPSRSTIARKPRHTESVSGPLASHAVRVSPETSRSPSLSRRRSNSSITSQAASDHSKGLGRSSWRGSSKTRGPAMHRYGPADYSHIPSRVQTNVHRIGVRSLTPTARRDASPATNASMCPPVSRLPTSPSARCTARSRPGTSSGLPRRQSRSSIERLSQPKRTAVPSSTYQGRSAQVPAGTRRRASTTSPPPHAGQAGKKCPGKPLTARRPESSTAQRRQSMPYPDAILDTLESVPEFGSLPAGSCAASEASTDRLVTGASCESFDADASAVALESYDRYGPQTSPPSSLSQTSTLPASSLPGKASPGGRTSVCAGGMRELHGSPSTTQSGSAARTSRKVEECGGEHADTAQSTFNAMNNLTSPVPGRRAEGGIPKRSDSPHLPAVPDLDLASVKVDGSTVMVRRSMTMASPTGSADGAVQGWLSRPVASGTSEPDPEALGVQGGDTTGSEGRKEASSVLGHASMLHQDALPDKTPRVDWNPKRVSPAKPTGPAPASTTAGPSHGTADEAKLIGRKKAAIHILGPFPASKMSTPARNSVVRNGTTGTASSRDQSSPSGPPPLKGHASRDSNGKEDLSSSGAGQNENVASNKP